MDGALLVNMSAPYLNKLINDATRARDNKDAVLAQSAINGINTVLERFSLSIEAETILFALLAALVTL